MKKKRLAFYLTMGLVIVAAAMLSGCKLLPGGGGVGCVSCENYMTLQGTIMDAVTGDRIGGKVPLNRRDDSTDIEIYLIQGATIRKPTMFISNPEDPLVGEYAFANIPIEVTDIDGVDPDGRDFPDTFKIVVIKQGYQRFEAEIQYTEVDTVIGNIYLFPENYYTPDYMFQVVYNGMPVDNATVGLMPRANNNAEHTQTGSILAASPGYLPALRDRTDSDGWVTFLGEDLALGSEYAVSVAPIKVDGVWLAPAVNLGPIIIGLAPVVDIIDLGDLVPGTDEGLFVVWYSSFMDDQVDDTGTLEIVFNRPVELGTAPTAIFTAIETSPAGILTAPPNQVNASLSSDGLTLTLTPNWATAPGAGENSTSITYAAGVIVVEGYPATSYTLGNLLDANGDGLNLTVNLSGP